MLTLVSFLLQLAALVLIARVDVDLVAALAAASEVAPSGRVRRGLHAITEPVLSPLRRVLPPRGRGPVGLDLSVTVMLVVLLLLRALLP